MLRPNASAAKRRMAPTASPAAQTAQAAGTDFCAVLNGTTPAAAFAPYPSVHIAPDLPDLRRWLGL